ncbi:D-2-hydroxyacid dehydrogenase (NADP+) [Halomicrobium zhouii]|uniref:D-2-hydroxyacid dehydrogenase (NADP+) n=1 Tax=Halomicrobium zhouii TaxID=767519 RepID=A0A1I6LZ58_9EURY|nr:D-2-hydroxyacid dehydrogenase [Halomicrobium zhouii]SFS08668.1 D-2-hydroxyacid dehydrogenase (NADP+) [Halomicrobium zhouii]
MDVGIHRSVRQIFPPGHLRELIADVGSVAVVPDDRPVEDCDALVTFAYEPAFLDADLDWIHSVQAGVDRFPFEDLSDRGIRLTNSTGIHGDAVGETVFGYMTSFARRLHVYRSNQERREWGPPAWDEAFTLAGQSVTVVGLGTLGRGVASRADCLGMHVTGVRRTPTPVDHVERVYTPTDLTEAVADARFVVLTVPLTEETRKLVGEFELDAMRSDAYLINVARGAVVDQAALLDALESGGLAGAALDVFEDEPLPADSPLWEMDDVVVTPHVAAATRDYADRIAALVRENCRRLEAGRSLANEVV